MAEHTKLPWQAIVTKDGHRLVGVCAEDGEGVLDAGYGVWSWDHPEGIANAKLVVEAVNAHQPLVDALLNARSIVRAYCGNLLRFTKEDADAGTIDAVAWTLQQQIEQALALTSAERE